MRIHLLTAGLLAFGFTNAAKAETVTAYFNGTVESAGGDLGFSGIKAGDSISGYFTLDRSALFTTDSTGNIYDYINSVQLHATIRSTTFYPVSVDTLYNSKSSQFEFGGPEYAVGELLRYVQRTDKTNTALPTAQELAGLSGQFVAYSVGGYSIYGPVTITRASTDAVPEPAAWGMMILGMGLIGFTIRRKNVMTRVSYAI